MLLNGTTIVVTGGNSGIGEAIVLAAAAEGANIVIDYVAHPDDTDTLMTSPPPPWVMNCFAANWVPKNALLRLMSMTRW